MKSVRLLPLLILVIALVGLPAPARAAVLETDSGIFYSVDPDAVTVEGFNAAGTVLDVPAEIDGLPVRYVADYACRGNTVLTEVHLPDSLLAVGDFAFADCPHLRRVSLQGGETLGFAAFRNCGDLTSVVLPETLTLLDDEAFYGCTRLGTIAIPAAVTHIGTDAFMGCDRLLLDVSDNPYAASYAKDNGIATHFTQTSAFTFLLIAGATLLLGGALLLLRRFLPRKPA